MHAITSPTGRTPDSDDDTIVSESTSPKSSLSQNDIEAIHAFVVGKGSSMRHMVKNTEYDNAKNHVYSLNPITVAEYIGESQELSSQVNPGAKKWNHLRKLFIQAVNESPTNLDGSLQPKQLLSKVIAPKSK